MPLFISPKLNLLFVLSTLLFCSNYTFASPFYVGGYIGKSTIHDDNFFDQLSNGKDVDYTNTNYSFLAGIALKQGFLLELEAGSIHSYVAKSPLSFSYEELSIENNYLRINLLQTFPLPGNFNWYLKESLGMISAKQSYTNATGLIEKQEKTNALYPGLSVGIQQEFFYHRKKISTYLEIQYSGYNLKNDDNTYHIRLNSFGAGIKWKF